MKGPQERADELCDRLQNGGPKDTQRKIAGGGNEGKVTRKVQSALRTAGKKREDERLGQSGGVLSGKLRGTLKSPQAVPERSRGRDRLFAGGAEDE
jgi:hypothetical protein